MYSEIVSIQRTYQPIQTRNQRSSLAEQTPLSTYHEQLARYHNHLTHCTYCATTPPPVPTPPAGMTAAPFVAEPPAELTHYNTREFEIRAEGAAVHHDNYQPEVHVTRLYAENTDQAEGHEKVSEPHVRREKVKKALKWRHWSQNSHEHHRSHMVAV